MCRLLFLFAMVTNISFAQLDNTDGEGLRDKPPPFTTEQNKTIFENSIKLCKSNCVHDFGIELGQANGVKAYSNCQSQCINPMFSFLNLSTGEVTVHVQNPKNDNLHYIGLINQCVEYARRWWMINKNITFGSIDSAHEIIYLTEGKNIRTNQNFPLSRSINGTAKSPPKIGDLVVYYPDRNNPLWHYGHVAVVVDVNLEQGSVSLAEENYDNKKWQKTHQYARQISLFNINGHYTLIDIAPNSNKNSSGGEISGWIYPKDS
ncbi:MAG: CHAP domain-containing protein [Alcanivoracaceae bacterium]|nr:CHAP domain-containing protein [Alcanivoracaceae bacterium]